MSTRQTIQSIKKQAKYLKKQGQDLSHAQCLDLAAQEAGYNSYKHPFGILGDGESKSSSANENHSRNKSQELNYGYLRKEVMPAIYAYLDCGIPEKRIMSSP